MIIFIITDIDGMHSISDKTLKKVSYMHDVMFINIADAMLTGINSFDMDTNSYIPNFWLFYQ